MILNDQENEFSTDTAPDRLKRKRLYKVFVWCCLLKFLVITPLVILISCTLFRVKPPRIQIKSSVLEGLSPSISFPIIKVDLNITLKLEILVYNPNHVSFKPEQGEALLLYKQDHVGDVQVNPGSIIPSRKSSALFCQVTLEANRFADSGLMSLVRDVMNGELPLKVKTRVPGTAKILFFRKHVVTTSECQLVIRFLDMKIISQDCKQKTKL